VATAAVAAATSNRPARNRAAGQARAPVRVQTATARDAAGPGQVVAAGTGVLGTSTAILPPEIATRPWPRSVLPQYASGGLTVGFGDHARGATTYNPFHSQAGIGNLPPITANAGDAEAGRAPQAADAASQP
jgi:hypothetical protein